MLDRLRVARLVELPGRHDRILLGVLLRGGRAGAARGDRRRARGAGGASGSPPVPSMALEEARKIRETVNAGERHPAAGAAAASSLPGWDPVRSARSEAATRTGRRRAGEGSMSASGDRRTEIRDLDGGQPVAARALDGEAAGRGRGTHRLAQAGAPPSQRRDRGRRGSRGFLLRKRSLIAAAASRVARAARARAGRLSAAARAGFRRRRSARARCRCR